MASGKVDEDKCTSLVCRSVDDEGKKFYALDFRFFNSQPRTHPDKEAGDCDEKDEYKPYSSGNVGESR
jgi:hypothetical protein